ncbi:MAG: acyl-CoA dehydrogenase family protein, partial [Thermoanaerobaculia bacterium]
MSSKDPQQISELESRKVAEASRQAEWAQPGFMRELFLGNFRLDLLHPYPLPGEERPEFAAFYRAFKEFLRDHVDPVEIDVTGEYPESVVDGLRKLGAFGMKIPKKYGGLGFTNGEYQRIMQLVCSVDGNLMALLSAHQSIGVPQPLKLFGSEELKKKYLPR